MERLENSGELRCYWKQGEGTPSPLVVVLAGTEEEAHACGEALEPQLEGASLAVVVTPGEDSALEEAVADLVYQWQLNQELDKNRFTLAAGIGATGLAWKLLSHYPQWFAGACLVGGYGDPYEARVLKDVPLRVYVPQEEAVRIQEGKVLAGAERLVAGLRIAGARCLETPQGGEALAPQAAWEQAFSLQGGAMRFLLAQDRRTQFSVEWVKPGLWRMDDYFSASCYLVEGTEKALLIDTGMGDGDLLGLASTLTTLPIEVAVTHPHLDHMHWIDRFSKVYLHKDDIAPLKENPSKYPMVLRGADAPLPHLIPLEEGSQIDLGGGVVIEALELPGHTAHSVVFVDDYHRCLFTGDALGSGDIVLLICPEKEAMNLVTRYREALQSFAGQLPRVREYAWLGGHYIQENGCDPRCQQHYLQGKSQVFNPLREHVLQDMIALCDGLLSGEVHWKQEPIHLEYHCELGCAGINFRFI
ncbi:MAG: MBL fold metallo-hydrolase [Acutalibacter sp.]|jgi:glyoxylase-like metal-dependent hydrolase (beta-lactamase superfamily II)